MSKLGYEGLDITDDDSFKVVFGTKHAEDAAKRKTSGYPVLR